MKAPNYIAFAIPFFLIFIGLELVVVRAQRRQGLYRLQDALADLGCGIGQQMAMVLVGAALLAAYAFIYRFRLVTFPATSLAPWLIAFAVVDFAYYWWHRASHQVNILWAAHAVHHQSEDYNLAVALRQSIVTSFTSLPFYYPMAFLGVSPTVYATMVATSTLYQFWIHTEVVGKLGCLEWVLNTPSHHRVHHAVNPQYLDRNYGATLIIWDRLFGTFTEEREPAVYGTTKPFGSFNPAWAQLQAWFEIAQKSRPLQRFRDRARFWLASPTVNPTGLAPPSDEELRARSKFAVPLPLTLKLYVLLQFMPLVAATFFMLLRQLTAPREQLLVAVGLVFWALASLGALLDGKKWGYPLELLRIAATAALIVAVRPHGMPLAHALPFAVAVVFACLAWLFLAARESRRGHGPPPREAARTALELSEA